MMNDIELCKAEAFNKISKAVKGTGIAPEEIKAFIDLLVDYQIEYIASSSNLARQSLIKAMSSLEEYQKFKEEKGW